MCQVAINPRQDHLLDGVPTVVFQVRQRPAQIGAYFFRFTFGQIAATPSPSL
jgi:hypothetical protein